MARNKRYTVKYKRKLNKKTDYRQRKILLASKKPRLIIRKSLKNLTAQIANFDKKGDKVIVTATTAELKKLGWNYSNNLSTAYLLGLLIGKKAEKNKIKEAILDLGLLPSSKGSKIYSVMKGAIDAGLKVPHNKNVLPPEDRINGKHIVAYAESLKSDQNKLRRQFSQKKDDPLKISEKLKELKSKILGK